MPVVDAMVSTVATFVPRTMRLSTARGAMIDLAGITPPPPAAVAARAAGPGRRSRHARDTPPLPGRSPERENLRNLLLLRQKVDWCIFRVAPDPWPSLASTSS